MAAKKTGKPAKGGEVDLGQSFAVNLVQHLVVPTFVLDAECNVLIWNKACERLTGVPAAELIGTREHWRAFYDSPRPCLADLLVQGRMDEVEALYAAHDDPSGLAFGVHAENWCIMPCLGTELYLAIDAGPIYDADGKLLAVIETGSFLAAAERLYVTQSAVSQAVKALEADLGETLLDRPAGRRGARVNLTAAGALFVPIAQEILRRFGPAGIRDHATALHRVSLRRV